MVVYDYIDYQITLYLLENWRKIVFLKAAILNYINEDALKNDFAVGNISIGFLGLDNVGLTTKIFFIR